MTTKEMIDIEGCEYVAIIRKEKGSGTWGVEFPQFPGCKSGGYNLNHAMDNAREALILHLDGIAKDLDGG